MDFRGKILRIHPLPNGTYDIPPGNLFPPGTPKTKPEIYVMGCRNPFRHFADPVTGCLYWGEVGPDAGKDSPRGPRGYDEFNRAAGPGYYGWPLFVADNQSYATYDWDTKQIGNRFDPAKPINDSPRNTGITELPPAQPAWIYYPYAQSDKFPELGSGGRCAMSGPVYHRDPKQTSSTRFPGYYDNTLFLYEWMRSWIKTVKLNDKGEQVGALEPFLPATKLRHAMDMRFGPEGALYVIEFGNNWWHPDQADIVRIDFVPGNRAPIAKASADVVVGKQPLTVHFSSAGTYDKDEGDTITYAWSFTGKAAESTEQNPSFTFEKPGVYQATLTVTDAGGKTAIAVVPIRVGNAAPKVVITEPVNGRFFQWGQKIAYRATVTDAEDGSTEGGTIPAAQVKVAVGYQVEREEATPGEEQGLSAGNNQRGKNRVFKSDCIACHQLAVQSVGPSFTTISAKYHGVDGILAKLTDKVITGGGGVWGPIAMAAHPQFTRDEIQEMVGWVLSIADDQGAIAGATGSFTAMAKPTKDDRGQYLIEARYTDKGAPGAEPLTGTATVSLRSRVVSASERTTSKGTGTEPTPDVGGGQHVMNIDAETWIGFKAITLDGTSKITYRVASGGPGGAIEIHVDSPTGPVISTTEIKPTGSWQKWVDVEGTIQDPGGTHDLVLVFAAPKGKKKLFNLNWIYFHPPGE
jgi:cytochrome c